MINYLNKLLITKSVNSPLPVLIVSLLVTFFITYGSIYVTQDDDMTNLLPDDIGSKKFLKKYKMTMGLQSICMWRLVMRAKIYLILEI